MAAVPSIGRADRAIPREADLTRTLYERYATQIFRYCLHQLGSREEAEDAVQSTFLNAFRGIKRGIVPEHESAWLFKIAENVCLSRRRSTWRRGRIESPTDFEVVEELAPAPSRLADELVGLQDVLEQMPESQRRAILLREWQGLSYREIGEELQLSQTAVETLIFRARRSLAKGLESPPESAQKRRLARGADLGNVLAGLKSLLLGGGVAAAKVAAVVAVVSAGTVVAASPTQHHRAPGHHKAPAVPAPAHPTTSVQAPTIAFHAPSPVRDAPKPAKKVPAPAPTVTVATHVPAIASEPATPTDVPPPSPATPDVAADSVSAEPPAKPAAPAAGHRATPPPPVIDNTPDNTLPPSDHAAGGPGNGQANGNGNGHSGDPGQSQGRGQGQGPSDSASTPPLQAGESGPGNGDGNGNGGQGHDSGPGH